MGSRGLRDQGTKCAGTPPKYGFSPDAVALNNRDPCTMTVLVVYASRHGATEGIAARIAARLADSGAAVDLRRVDQVEALDAYDAVVFGAPVYDQSWPPEADRFVTAHRDALAARPLWLFSVGSFGDTKRLIGPLTHKEPKGIAAGPCRHPPARVPRLPGRHPQAPVAVLVTRVVSRLWRTFRRPPRLAGDRRVGRPDRPDAAWSALGDATVMRLATCALIIRGSASSTATGATADQSRVYGSRKPRLVAARQRFEAEAPLRAALAGVLVLAHCDSEPTPGSRARCSGDEHHPGADVRSCPTVGQWDRGFRENARWAGRFGRWAQSLALFGGRPATCAIALRARCVDVRASHCLSRAATPRRGASPGCRCDAACRSVSSGAAATTSVPAAAAST